MNISKTLVCASLAVMLPVSTAMARGDGLNRVERRLDRQDMRIENGVESGELTRKETKRLRKQHRRIKRLKRDFLRDGRLSRDDRHTLMNKLDRASKRIYRLKHNDRYRKSRQQHYRRDHAWSGDYGRYQKEGVYFSDDGLTVYLSFSNRW